MGVAFLLQEYFQHLQLPSNVDLQDDRARSARYPKPSAAAVVEAWSLSARSRRERFLRQSSEPVLGRWGDGAVETASQQTLPKTPRKGGEQGSNTKSPVEGNLMALGRVSRGSANSLYVLKNQASKPSQNHHNSLGDSNNNTYGVRTADNSLSPTKRSIRRRLLLGTLPEEAAPPVITQPPSRRDKDPPLLINNSESFSSMAARNTARSVGLKKSYSNLNITTNSGYQGNWTASDSMSEGSNNASCQSPASVYAKLLRINNEERETKRTENEESNVTSLRSMSADRLNSVPQHSRRKEVPPTMPMPSAGRLVRHSSTEEEEERRRRNLLQNTTSAILANRHAETTATTSPSSPSSTSSTPASNGLRRHFRRQTSEPVMGRWDDSSAISSDSNPQRPRRRGSNHLGSIAEATLPSCTKPPSAPASNTTASVNSPPTATPPICAAQGISPEQVASNTPKLESPQSDNSIDNDDAELEVLCQRVADRFSQIALVSQTVGRSDVGPTQPNLPISSAIELSKKPDSPTQVHDWGREGVSGEDKLTRSPLSSSSNDPKKASQYSTPTAGHRLKNEPWMSASCPTIIPLVYAMKPSSHEGSSSVLYGNE